VLTKKKLDKIQAWLEHSPRTPLTQLVQQAQVLITKAWRATKSYVCSCIKLYGFKQLKKVIMKEKCIFVIDFCVQHMMVSLIQNIHFFTDKNPFLSEWVHQCSIIRTTGVRAVLICDRLLKYPFTIRWLMCGVKLLLHK
jgi:hypothetical protein